MWCKSLEVLNPYEAIKEALKEANMTDLKPCPVCGSTYLFKGKGVSCNTLRIIRYFRLTFPYGVTCMNCGFHKETIRAWNRRAGEEDNHEH